MPRIVRYGAFNFVNDAVKIHDTMPDVQILSPDEMPFATDFEKTLDDEAFAHASPGTEGELAGGGTAGEEADSADAAQLPQQANGMPAGDEQVPAVKGEIIQQAMSEASRIIQEAMEQARQAKEEALAGIPAEVEEIKRRAADEARQEAFASTVQTLEKTALNLENAIATYEGQRAGFEVEYEEQLKWLATEIAGKVLAKKVSEDDAVLADMVQKAVQSVKNEPWIRVEVAQEMVRLLDALTQIYDETQSVQVSAVPLQAGTVHVETPSGVIDVSLRTQLANLKDYFVSGTS